MIQEGWALFQAQEGCCALSGLPLTFGNRVHGSDITASLDRVKSSKPYCLENVQWVHKDINKMKQDLSQDRFLQLCLAVGRQHP